MRFSHKSHEFTADEAETSTTSKAAMRANVTVAAAMARMAMAVNMAAVTTKGGNKQLTTTCVLFYERAVLKEC